MDNDKDWVCTDPDNKQYGRKISDTVYEFKERGLIQEEIDLAEYTEEQIQDALDTYGLTRDSIKDYHGEDMVNWIIAECLYELHADIDEDEMNKMIEEQEEVALSIPKKDLAEVTHLIRYALCEQRSSNDVWSLLMKFCEEYSPIKLDGNPEEVVLYSSKYSNK